MSRLLAFAALLTALMGAPAAGQAGQAEVVAEAQRWLQALRQGSAAERSEAFTQLSRLGPEARPVLEQALDDSDPDVRFNLLLLLHEPDGRLEKLLREVVVGQTTNSASYPRAMEAYKKILASRGDISSLLILTLRRRARALGARERDLRDRTLTVGLSVLRDLFADPPPGFVITADHANQVAGLLELDLGSGFSELVTVLQALPSDLALDALAARARGGGALVRARAARALSEVASAGKAQDAAQIAFALLGDGEARVRRAALECLDLLALPDQALMPIVPRVQDQDMEVRATALRIAGERGLVLVREQAESVAGDVTRPLRLRKLALRALGLLGVGSPPLLLGLSQGKERDLAVLAAWALGCQHSPKARDVLLGLIAREGFSQENVLYHGLSRLGGEEGCAALAGLLGPQRPERDKRPRAIRALGFVEDASGPASRVLGSLAGQQLVEHLGQSGPTGAEVEAALEALAELGDGPALGELAQVLVMPRRAPQLAVSLPLVVQVGGPPEPALRERLVHVLERTIRNDTSPGVRAQAAHALARVDPAQALTVLRQELRRLSPSETAREYARALARAGDVTQIEERALPFSRDQLERAAANLRGDLLNDVGIDLLYAGRSEEAMVEFRRMIWCRPSDEVAAYNIACGYALIGKVELSLHYLRRSIMLGYKKHRHIRSDTDLNALHADPRFKRLIRQLRLAEETQIQPQNLLGWAED